MSYEMPGSFHPVKPHDWAWPLNHRAGQWGVMIGVGLGLFLAVWINHAILGGEDPFSFLDDLLGR